MATETGAASPAAALALADARARERALYADGSLLVRAPAGSGKTELLIQRFLRLLATVEQPERVVALTFSRKAAAEMRGRLLRAIETAAGEAPAESHRRLTWELARSVSQRDAARGWRLLQTPSRLRIMTLDAMALELVGRMPWLSRFGATPRPTEAAVDLYRAAARATLQRIEGRDGETRGAEAARRLLRHLNADVGAVEELLADLLGNRDQWLDWIAGAGDGERLRDGIESEIQRTVESELAAARAILEASGVPGLPPGSNLAAWRAMAQEILTTEGKQRKAWKRADLSPAACAALHALRRLPDPQVPPQSWEVVGALLALLPVAVAELRLIFGERGECDFTEVTLGARQGLGTADAPSPLAFELDTRLQHLFVDEFQDTSRAQFDLLRTLVADWAEGDGRTLFLVGDPMQSIYGWRNAQVGLFLRTAARQRLGQLRLQALELSANYRSQAGLVAWCNSHFGHPHVSAGDDDAARGAAKFVPAAATRAASEPAVEIHALPGRNPLLEAVRVADLVEAELRAGGPVPGSAATIAILAQSRGHLRAILPELLRRGIRYQGVELLSLAQSPVVSDLLALTRALHQPADRIAWLAVLRAPWCGLTLADLLALCGDQREAAVAELLQDEARVRRLSADGQRRLAPVAATLAAAARQRGRTPARALVEWCWRALDGAALAPAARRGDAAAFLDLLEEFDRRGALHDLEALEQAAAKLHSPPDPTADARVQIMTAHQAKGLEFDTVILPGLGKEPMLTPGALLRWTEQPGDDDTTRWLMAPKPESGGNDLLYEFVGERQQQRRDQEQLRLLYVAATRARRRLHLVAFFPTNRERDRLIEPAQRSPLARIWPAVKAEFERQFREHEWKNLETLRQDIAAAMPTPPAAPPALRRVPADWTPPHAGAAALGEPAAPPARTPSRLRLSRGELQRQVGTAVHAALQRMAERGDLRWSREHLRTLLLMAGVAAGELDDGVLRATRALEQTVADPRGRWILAPHPEAHCEWALSGLVDGVLVHGVVDRSFVDEDGQRWIIDYKTAFHSGGDAAAFLDQQVLLYRPQLEAYAALAAGVAGPPFAWVAPDGRSGARLRLPAGDVRSARSISKLAPLEPVRRVRCGLYFPLAAAWREI